MMKLAFALVVLFHLCHSTPARNDPNLNKEMIKTMDILNNRPFSFPSGFNLSHPDKKMRNNPSHCVIPFIRGLEEVLANITVPENIMHHLKELKANLKKLESNQENTPKTNGMCKLIQKGNTSSPFHYYIMFIQKLNYNK